MHVGPLVGETVSAADWPAPRLARDVLVHLGAEPVDHTSAAAVHLGADEVNSRRSTPEEDWEASGLPAVTKRRDGPELTPHGAPATLARGLALAFQVMGGARADGAALLGARLADRPPASDTRLLRCTDGWVVLTLSRPGDLELIPALVERAALVDAWEAVTEWAAALPADEVVRRGVLLGLPVARAGEHEDALPWTLRPVAATHDRSDLGTVINLGSLWAAPLAAQLLCRSGARVVDVNTGREGETSSRWREDLRAGHDIARIDLSSSRGRADLRTLLLEADVVLEASRPRALRQLGLAAEDLPGSHARAWVRLTGHPRPAERVAFGDDAAAAGGLLAWDEAGPVLVGDAVADPLAGLTAAVLALACCRGSKRWVVDLSLAGVAATAARYPLFLSNQGKVNE